MLSVAAPTGVHSEMISPANTNFGFTRAQVFWDPSPGATGYNIERSDDGATGWSVTSGSVRLPSSAQDYIDPQNDSGKKEYYRVVAFDATSSATSAVTSPFSGIDSVVPVSVDLASDASGIRLVWQPVPLPVYFEVQRYTAGSTTSDLFVTLTGSPSGYYDASASDGVEYKYTIRARLPNGIIPALDQTLATTSIRAARELPIVSNRGNILVVIDSSIDVGSTTPALDVASRIQEYEADLGGDGWNVLTLHVARDTDDPSNASDVVPVKTQIQSIYNTLGGNLASISLIGHVPVPLSDLGYEHHGVTFPFDSYYGDLISLPGDWTDVKNWMDDPNITTPPFDLNNTNVAGDGKFDQVASPSPIEVPVGRVDFAHLIWPASDVGATSVGEIEPRLLTRYLNRLHAFKTGAFVTSKTAIVDDGFSTPGYFPGGWDGAGSVVGVAAAKSADWKTLKVESHLWALGGGPGFPSPNNTITGIVQPGDYSTTDSVGVTLPYHAVFNQLEGSFSWDTDEPYAPRRAVLANSGDGLASFGGPGDFNFDQMSMGGTLASTARLATEFTGDPALRQDAVKPITNLMAAIRHRDTTTSTDLSWTAPAGETVGGYYIYWSATPNGGFTLLNPSAMVTTTRYNDPSHSSGFYMVRAAKLTSSFSGSYWNQSIGKIAKASDGAFTFGWKDLTQSVTYSLPPTEAAFDVTAPGALTISARLYVGANQSLVTYNLVNQTDYEVYGGDTDAETGPFGVITFHFVDGNATSIAMPSGIYTVTMHGAVGTYTHDFVYLGGDVDNNGIVNFDDFLVLAANYNMSATDPGNLLDFDSSSFAIGDFNNDGMIDFNDLLVLATDYNVDLNALWLLYG